MNKQYLFATVSVLGFVFATSAAMADSNRVYLDQYDTNQHATVDQSGSSNSVGTSGSHFYQQNGGLSGGNNLTVNQSGNGNTVARDAAGYQSGSANTALINQAGVNSDVELQQNGTQNGSGGIGWTNSSSYNSIAQDVSSNGSKVELSQSGNNNVFDLGQGGGNNRTTVSQSAPAVRHLLVSP